MARRGEQKQEEAVSVSCSVVAVVRFPSLIYLVPNSRPPFLRSDNTDYSHRRYLNAIAKFFLAAVHDGDDAQYNFREYSIYSGVFFGSWFFFIRRAERRREHASWIQVPIRRRHHPRPLR